ncbi:hypothetical protein BKA69DRAFT_1036091 [Paraphysoderma sedebokerense]|nr:hypothetical protein BKA69DRAFT_1036091 [Paraphysoderma sedebokerense]
MLNGTHDIDADSFNTPPRRITQIQDTTPAALSPSSTPFLSRLSEKQLLHRLKDALRLIKEKDRDLVLAAEIGKSLLQSNETLKLEFERLSIELANTQQQSIQEQQASPPSQPLSASLLTGPDAEVPIKKYEEERLKLSKQLADVERHNAELEARLDTAIRSHDELEKATSRRVASLESKNESQVLEIESWKKKCDELEDSNRRLASEKVELVKSRNVAVGSSEQMQELQGEIYRLQDEMRLHNAQKYELEQMISSLHEELRLQESHTKELESQLEEFSIIKSSYDIATVQIDTLTMDLESAQDTIRHLETQLANFIPKYTDGPVDRGSKTLFSEVEDRRAELENKQKTLLAKHKNLLQVHSIQSNRMRKHIDRLTMLSGSSASDESRIQRLEQALSQLQSENKELQYKLSQFEKVDYNDSLLDLSSLSALNSSTSSTTTLNPSKANITEVIECLQLRVQQLSSESEKLKKELRTSQMIRLSETEKLRVTETKLCQIEVKLTESEKMNAKLQFELDEFKLQSRVARSDLELESANGLEKTGNEAVVADKGDNSDSDSNQVSSPAQDLGSNGTSTSAFSASIRTKTNEPEGNTKSIDINNSKPSRDIPVLKQSNTKPSNNKIRLSSSSTLKLPPLSLNIPIPNAQNSQKPGNSSILPAQPDTAVSSNPSSTSPTSSSSSSSCSSSSTLPDTSLSNPNSTVQSTTTSQQNPTTKQSKQPKQIFIKRNHFAINPDENDDGNGNGTNGIKKSRQQVDGVSECAQQ